MQDEPLLDAMLQSVGVLQHRGLAEKVLATQICNQAQAQGPTLEISLQLALSNEVTQCRYEVGTGVSLLKSYSQRYAAKT